MHVLVTRPEPDALKMVGYLHQRGHQATAFPLMSTSYSGLQTERLDGVTGLIATSRHALRALVGTASLEQARNLTIFAVGKATAMEARRMGFSRIVKGPGTAAALSPLIASLVDPAEEVLLHLAGDRVAYDLAGELGHQGLNVSKAIVYQMHAAREVPESIRRMIGNRTIEAVMLMSPQTASIWSRLVTHHGLSEDVREIVHLCLSQAVADRLRAGPGAMVEVATTPTLEDMLEQVEMAAEKLGS
ncbi:MAG: uroporphyrinogen-III synthase [Hyphomicrobiaceae bacterium]